MDEGIAESLARSGYGKPGFAERYDAHRPRPPEVLASLLPAVAAEAPPRLVVDVGSGSGLSTRFWADCAVEVLGVEPNDAMRAFAETRTSAAKVRYVGASGEATGLPAAIASIVTASQSLQWMDPEHALPEIARILRPGGVFCAYQYVTLVTPFWEPERVWARVRERVRVLREERGFERDQRRWPVTLQRIESAGCFDDCREVPLHSVEQGDATRLVGFALSEGSVQTLLAAGATEADIGLDELRDVAARTIGDEPCPWLIGYTAWVALKGRAA